MNEGTTEVLLVFRADNKDEIGERLEADPWTQSGILSTIKIVKKRAVLSRIGNAKPQKGTYEAFKYAPLEEIDKHLRPLLAGEEMDLSYSDEPCEGGGLLIRGRLEHLPTGH